MAPIPSPQFGYLPICDHDLCKRLSRALFYLPVLHTTLPSKCPRASGTAHKITTRIICLPFANSLPISTYDLTAHSRTSDSFSLSFPFPFPFLIHSDSDRCQKKKKENKFRRHVHYHDLYLPSSRGHEEERPGRREQTRTWLPIRGVHCSASSYSYCDSYYRRPAPRRLLARSPATVFYFTLFNVICILKRRRGRFLLSGLIYWPAESMV